MNIKLVPETCWISDAFRQGLPSRGRFSQGEECGIGFWVGNKGHVKHQGSKVGPEVETILKAFDNNVLRQVLAIVGDEAVVGQSVHHGAWATDYIIST